MFDRIRLAKTPDFPLGDAHAWAGLQVHPLVSLDGKGSMATTLRAAYSDTGLYFRFDCRDGMLATHMTENFDNLYEGDVVELFLQPNRAMPLYFEYELNPLGAELPLLVANNRPDYHGWLPFQYRGERKTRTHVAVQGGKQACGAPCTGWRAECFLPFALLAGLSGIPPKAGDIWRGNAFRIDFDRDTLGERYGLFPDCGVEFHDYEKFSDLIFEV